MEFFWKFAILTQNPINFDVTCSVILGTPHYVQWEKSVLVKLNQFLNICVLTWFRYAVNIFQYPYLSGDNSGQRESVSDPLSHGHYIWHHTVPFKSPKMLACSAKPSLDFIGNAKAPMWSYFIEGSSHITFWILNTSSNTLGRKLF